jgi:LuxR family maltose regulon positive regulatory protein
MDVRSALGSKLTPPPLPSRLVRRPRLSSALASRPLTLVSAGAGCGKTVLLSRWAAESTVPTAWLSVDASDNEPGRFWPLVGTALRAAGALADGVDVAVPYDEDDPSMLLTALTTGLVDDTAAVIVLDDAHLITHEALLGQLDAIVRYGWPRLRLVLGCRSDPLLPLHRYRLAGWIAELRAADLAMTRAEAGALLSAHGVSLPMHDLQLLTERTEGWVAGLRLSAMSMAGSAHPEQFVSQLALDQGSAGEYLIEEVLSRQPGETRRLLIQTSILGIVSGPIAQAITGIAESGALLAELARSNSFVIPLDRTGSRFRYHQLLLEILRYLLKHEYRDEEAELRRRAAVWYQQHDEPTLAVHFAIGADDGAHAAHIIVHGGLAKVFVARQDLSTFGLDDLSALLARRPADAEQTPEVQLTRAVIAVARGRLDEAAAHLGAARNHALDPDAEATAMLVELVAAQRTGSVSEVDRLAGALLSTSSGHDASPMRAALRLTQAATRFWNDGSYSFAQIQTLLSEAVTEASRCGATVLEFEGLGLLRLSYASTGRTDHLKEASACSRALLRENPSLRLTTAHHLTDAYTGLMRGDLRTTERALRRAHQSMTADVDPALRAAVVYLTAWTLMTSGRAADAYGLLTTAPELNAVLPAPVARRRAHLLAAIEVRLGRPTAALKLLSDEPATSTHPLVAAVRARAYTSLGDAESARRCLPPALIEHESATPLPLLVDLLLVSATADELAGDEAGAVAKVLRACDLARNRTVVPFVDMRQACAGLLARHPEARAAWPEAAGPPTVESTQTWAATHLVDPLTDRELAVLRRLASMMTTQEIAAELCVSINTVKTHIAAVYRKLPAEGRHDAVARARQLELL